MALYAITIAEELSRTVITEADSFEQAYKQVEEAYNNEEIVLDYRDFCGEVDFSDEERIVSEEEANYCGYQRV